MKIVYISASKNHSQAYHRCIEPARWLNQYFHAAEEDSLALLVTSKDFEDNYASAISIVDQADVLVFHTTHEPFLMLMEKYKGKKKIIVDFDDAEDLFVTERYLGLTKWIQGWDVFAPAMMELADAVTCTTPILAEHIKQICGKEAVVISNAIDYTLPMWNRERKKYTDAFDVGYLGGQYSNPVLMEYLPTMIHTNGLNVNFHYCGMLTESLAHNTKRANIFIHKNYPFIDYGSFYSGLDCVFVFIQSDEIGRCKSQLKLLEAAAYNLNVIVENKEPYSRYIEEEPEVFIPISSPEDLHAAIEIAKTKHALTRQWADARYSIHNSLQTRIKLFEA